MIIDIIYTVYPFGIGDAYSTFFIINFRCIHERHHIHFMISIILAIHFIKQIETIDSFQQNNSD